MLNHDIKNIIIEPIKDGIAIENDEVKIGSPFEITQIKGCDIFAKLIDNMENKAKS